MSLLLGYPIDGGMGEVHNVVATGSVLLHAPQDGEIRSASGSLCRLLVEDRYMRALKRPFKPSLAGIDQLYVPQVVHSALLSPSVRIELS